MAGYQYRRSPLRCSRSRDCDAWISIRSLGRRHAGNDVAGARHPGADDRKPSFVRCVLCFPGRELTRSPCGRSTLFPRIDKPEHSVGELEDFVAAPVRHHPAGGGDSGRWSMRAGPTGFGLARYLIDAGIDCVVAAPSKLQRPSGDRVKTDAVTVQGLMPGTTYPRGAGHEVIGMVEALAAEPCMARTW
jgi:hypothetical protein